MESKLMEQEKIMQREIDNYAILVDAFQSQLNDRSREWARRRQAANNQIASAKATMSLIIAAVMVVIAVVAFVSIVLN